MRPGFLTSVSSAIGQKYVHLPLIMKSARPYDFKPRFTRLSIDSGHCYNFIDRLVTSQTLILGSHVRSLNDDFLDEEETDLALTRQRTSPSLVLFQRPIVGWSKAHGHESSGHGSLIFHRMQWTTIPPPCSVKALSCPTLHKCRRSMTTNRSCYLSRYPWPSCHTRFFELALAHSIERRHGDLQ